MLAGKVGLGIPSAGLLETPSRRIVEVNHVLGLTACVVFLEVHALFHLWECSLGKLNRLDVVIVSPLKLSC